MALTGRAHWGPHINPGLTQASLWVILSTSFSVSPSLSLVLVAHTRLDKWHFVARRAAELGLNIFVITFPRRVINFVSLWFALRDATSPSLLPPLLTAVDICHYALHTFVRFLLSSPNAAKRPLDIRISCRRPLHLHPSACSPRIIIIIIVFYYMFSTGAASLSSFSYTFLELNLFYSQLWLRLLLRLLRTCT